MEGELITERLATFAALLELADVNPYTARAYRRAAETIRGLPVGVADFVRIERVRELRGIGPGIEARLRELVQTRKRRGEFLRYVRSASRWRTTRRGCRTAGGRNGHSIAFDGVYYDPDGRPCDHPGSLRRRRGGVLLATFDLDAMRA